jgi:hypothetical protein
VETDILTALRAVMASLPDPDTVPKQLDMHRSLFFRLEALQRHAPSTLPSPFDPFLPISFDDNMSPSAIRITYATGRKEIIVLVP